MFSRLSSIGKFLNFSKKNVRLVIRDYSTTSDLKLVTVCSGISKDLKKPSSKRNTIGDDAWFIASHQKSADVLGVADGVGGWRDVGVDPSLFSSQLMLKCQQFVDKLDNQLDQESPVNILDHAYRALIERQDDSLIGSCTACILLFNRHSQYLHAANLGDSGFVVVRNNQIVHRSCEQQHYFNCPFQVTLLPSTAKNEEKSDLPNDASKSSFKLREGDFVILATDGLWDNLSDLDLLAKLDGLKKDLEKVAQSIVSKTLQLSRDMNYISPFSISAKQNGFNFLGGKPDDITLLLARVEAN